MGAFAVKQPNPDLFTLGKDLVKEGNVIHIINPFLYYSFQDLFNYLEDVAIEYDVSQSRQARYGDVDEKYLQDLREWNALARVEVDRRVSLKGKLPASVLNKRKDYYFLSWKEQATHNLQR